MQVTIKQFRDKGGKPIAGRTPEHAVYDSDGRRLDGKMKEMLSDGWVEEKRLSKDSVVTEKIKDRNVTMEKLSVEVRDIIEAGTGVDSGLIADMEEWNGRIAALESAKLQPRTAITAAETVEWHGGATSIPVSVSLQDNGGPIDDDSNYTDKKTVYSYSGHADSSESGEAAFEILFSTPKSSTITAQGSARYKGAGVAFPKASKTVYAVLPSYIGYIDDYNHWSKTGEKLVKHSLSGSYNVTNGYAEAAYMVVAVPTDGAVNAVSRIVQHGTLDAEQQLDKVEKDGYTLYVCRTKHNPGTYNFILS